MAEKQCSKCGEVKPHEQFPTRKNRAGETVRRGQCSECYLGDVRAKRAAGHYTIDHNKAVRRRRRTYLRHAAARKAVGRPVLTVWEKIPSKVACAAKRGKEYWPVGCVLTSPKPRESSESVEARKQARAAWSWWINTGAPDRWVRDAYRAIGKPWSNPRLSKSEQWRIRYWCDPSFRAKEIEKVQRTKAKRRKRIDETSDGTLTGDVIVRLFACAKHCHYCGKKMRSVEKSLDHVIPLDRGGPHSISNVVVACKPCNFSKHTSTVDEWRDRLKAA